MDSLSQLRETVIAIIEEGYIGLDSDSKTAFRRDMVEMLQRDEGFSRREAMKFWLDCVTRVQGRC